MSNSLIIEQQPGYMIIRFNQPEIRNPLSVTVLDELDEILTSLGARGRQTPIIFTGSGDAFASGADLREIAAVTVDKAREFALRGQRLMQKIADFPVVSVAAINGYCFGGALDLALACRYRIALPNATFAHPGANLGIITGWGGTQRLPHLIGEARALEMFFTATPTSADEALEIGLIDQISDDPVEAAKAKINSI